MIPEGFELYPAWTAGAACRGSRVPDWAFGTGAQQHAFIATYCDGCPVKAECLAYSDGDGGVWGGTTAHQRGGRKRPHPVIRCGTDSGYTRHQRLGEEPCTPCRVARAEASRRRYHGGGKSPTDTGKCGTYAGYQRHRAAGEVACDPCMDAQRTYAARRRAG